MMSVGGSRSREEFCVGVAVVRGFGSSRMLMRESLQVGSDMYFFL